MMRKGFTLIEVVITLMIMAMMSGIFMLNISTVEKQTASKEAERLAHWLSSKIVQANSKRSDFELTVNNDYVNIKWNNASTANEKYTASKGCAFSWNAPSSKLEYVAANSRFYSGATITVTGEGDPYYVIIAALGSRVRVSDSSASD